MNRITKKILSFLRMMSMHGPWRVINFLAATLIPRSLVRRWYVAANIQDSTMLLDARDPGISRALFTMGVREIYHLHQIWACMGHGMTGIDLGANIGYYALIESRIVGDTGRIFCIEPEPDNAELLRRNLILNGREHTCSVHQLAIGDRSGSVEFRLSSFSNRHGMSSKHYYGTKAGVDSQVIQVPMLTLDNFMEQQGLKPADINFIRMDIEGYEVMAFQGMTRLLGANTPLVVFIEFHPKYYAEWGWSFERFLDYLESHRLRIRSLAYERKKRIPIILQDPTREQVLASVEDGGNATGGSHAVLVRYGV